MTKKKVTKKKPSKSKQKNKWIKVNLELKEEKMSNGRTRFAKGATFDTSSNFDGEEDALNAIFMFIKYFEQMHKVDFNSILQVLKTMQNDIKTTTSSIEDSQPHHNPMVAEKTKVISKLMDEGKDKEAEKLKSQLLDFMLELRKKEANTPFINNNKN